MISTWKPWLAAAFAAVSMLVVGQLIENYQRRSMEDHDRQLVSGQLGQLRANLEREVIGNLLMLRGLSAVIAAQPDIDQSGFAAIARRMVGDRSPLRNIAGAPDLVVRLMYPVEGNESVIGLDYRAHPAQRDAALQAVERRQMVVAGPLQLVQGGSGLVAREPVFLSSASANEAGSDLWGLVAAVIDVDKLYELAGVTGHRERLGLDLAIRGRDGLGAEGDVFYGSPDLFEREAETAEVSLPYGSWQIAALPSGGWGGHMHADEIHATRLITLVLAILLAALTYRLLRDNRILRQTSDELRDSESKYRLLVENQTDLIVRVGPEGRFEFVSPSYCRMFGKNEDELLGHTFMPLVHEEDQAATAEAMQDLSRPPYSCQLEQRAMTAQGWRWLAWSDTAVLGDDGQVQAVIGSGRDVTDRKLAELALRESEAQYRRLFEYTPLGILVADAEGRYTDANPAMCRMLGFTHDDLVGLCVSDIVQASEKAHIEPALKAIMSDHDHYGVWAFVRKDGSRFDAEVSATTLPDGQRIALVRDITEQEKVQRELRESERRFRAVFDQQFQFSAILTPEGETLEINELPLRQTGAPRDAYAGKLFWKSPAWASLPEWQKIWPRRIADANASDDAILTQDVYLAADGELREAAAATKAIRDEQGNVEFVLVQALDNTEQRRAEKERDRLVADLQSLNEQLEQIVTQRTAQLLEANRELESFAYAVSHDLRAPVRAISGFETALREDHGAILPAEGIEFLDEIRAGAIRMNALIDGLLDLSRSTRGDLNRETVDLGQMARDIFAHLRRGDTQRQVKLIVQGDLHRSGDPRLLQTLMQNLLENAWKYTSLREDAVIRVTGEDEGIVCVEDNGVGFDPAFSHKLFEPFQRLHRQDEFPGVGIGLATAARILRRHGGALAGCGRPGMGAVFCFYLGSPTGE
ncbi:MAG: PAS domain S-box protein [Gammaproteobacteria bacterium]|nr:PAS domain S-box protein [Gammaproteobacteria bacterium]